MSNLVLMDQVCEKWPFCRMQTFEWSFPLCWAAFEELRSQLSVCARCFDSKWTLEPFDSIEKVIRVWISSAAGIEPDMLCILGSALFCRCAPWIFGPTNKKRQKKHGYDAPNVFKTYSLFNYVFISLALCSSYLDFFFSLLDFCSNLLDLAMIYFLVVIFLTILFKPT